jgi:hypothetical protein
MITGGITKAKSQIFWQSWCRILGGASSASWHEMCRLQWILVTLSEYISTEVNKLAQTMTKLELLDALKAMTVAEQLEVLEVTSKIIRDRLSDLAPERLRERTNLEIAVEKMHSFYAEGSDLTAFTDRNTEDFYEYTEYA